MSFVSFKKIGSKIFSILVVLTFFFGAIFVDSHDFSRNLEINLIGRSGTNLADLKIVASHSISNNVVTISFDYSAGDSLNGKVIDGVSFNLLFNASFNVQLPLVTNVGAGKVFDAPSFVDLRSGRNSNVTFYDLGIVKGKTGKIFDFSYALGEFVEHDVNISAQTLTSSGELGDLIPIIYRVYRVSNVSSSTGSGGGGGGGSSSSSSSGSTSTVKSPTTEVFTKENITKPVETIKEIPKAEGELGIKPEVKPETKPEFKPGPVKFKTFDKFKSDDKDKFIDFFDQEVEDLSEIIFDAFDESFEEEFVVENGIIKELTVVKADENLSLFIGENVIVDENGVPFSGEIAPVAVAEEVVSETLALKPSNVEVSSKVYEIGLPGKSLFLEKPVTLLFEVTDNFSIDFNYKVNYFDEKDKSWKIAGDGRVIVDAKGKGFVATRVNHFTLFAVFKDEKTEEEKKMSVGGRACDFADVKDHWGVVHIKYLCARKIVHGYEDGTFGPDRPITRAEFLKIVLESDGVEVDADVGVGAGDAKELPFGDKNLEKHWSLPYLRIGKEKNIIAGYKDGTFGPDKPVNRAEALKILLESKGVDIATKFRAIYKDIDYRAWYVKYLNFATERMIVSGYKDGTFKPIKDITRAEASKIIHKIMEPDAI